MAYSKYPHNVFMIGSGGDPPEFDCMGCVLMPTFNGERGHWHGKTYEEAIEHLRRHKPRDYDPEAIPTLEAEIKRHDEIAALREDEIQAKRLKLHRKRLGKATKFSGS